MLSNVIFCVIGFLVSVILVVAYWEKRHWRVTWLLFALAFLSLKSDFKSLEESYGIAMLAAAVVAGVVIMTEERKCNTAETQKPPTKGTGIIKPGDVYHEEGE